MAEQGNPKNCFANTPFYVLFVIWLNNGNKTSNLIKESLLSFSSKEYSLEIIKNL